MFQEKEQAAELSRILAQLKENDHIKSDSPAPSDLEQRIEQLIHQGFSKDAARAIATLELDPEIRNQITLDIASHMFGGGFKESRSALVIWSK